MTEEILKRALLISQNSTGNINLIVFYGAYMRGDITITN